MTERDRKKQRDTRNYREGQEETGIDRDAGRDKKSQGKTGTNRERLGESRRKRGRQEGSRRDREQQRKTGSDKERLGE